MIANIGSYAVVTGASSGIGYELAMLSTGNRSYCSLKRRGR
jgi:short-subunit dehydrogenase